MCNILRVCYVVVGRDGDLVKQSKMVVVAAAAHGSGIGEASSCGQRDHAAELSRRVGTVSCVIYVLFAPLPAIK